jgi:YidC/Oxa1 family membrane protein insertase
MLPDQDNQKNLLLAIALSIAVLLGWQVFYAGPKLKEEQERRQRVQTEQTQAKKKQEPGTTAPAAAPDARPGTAPTAGPAAVQEMSRPDAIRKSDRIQIDTPSLKGSIALTGGRIDDLVLSKYHETTDPKSPDVVLFSPSGAPNPYYAEYGWVPAAGTTPQLPNSQTVWRAESGGPLTPSSPVTLVWDNGQGLVFRRTISVDADYLFKVVDSVENKTASAVSLFPYALISRHGTPHTLGYYILHEGPIGVIGEDGLKEIHYADLLKEGGTKTFKKETGGWLGITDKYWAAALIPNQKVSYDATFSGEKAARDRYQTSYLLESAPIPPGGRSETTSHLFAGAKQVALVEAYQAQLGAKNFDLLIDWGWFWFFTKPLYQLLHWLSHVLGNYGLAILATTVIVKAAFFPLANKSYESMAKMKKLQPEMEKLRERFKDDRVKQQQELMALYKAQKINPMAGCLPIALQVPVFFALYKVLFITIDMRHAPFFGWIKDLSAPDPTSLFNLFGLLPFQAPDFLHVGLWPLIMGVTMFVQMQLNPQQPDPIQQKIFTWMPVLFTFMLASFPSGLVIYWAWNNILSLIQQHTIMKKNGAEIHLWKNLGLDKWAGALQGASRGGGSNSGGGGIGGGVGNIGAALKEGIGKLRERLALPARSASPAPERSTKTSDLAGELQSRRMTREQALQTLGLEPDASDIEIDAALGRAERNRQPGPNGSGQAIAARINEAREVLRGKESS